MRKNVTAYLILALCILFAVTACRMTDEKSMNKVQTVTTADYPVAYEIDSVIKSSDYIASGYFHKFNSTWNMARNPENLKEEDPNILIEGKLYDYVIKEDIRGNLNKKNSIVINIPYSFEGDIDKLFIEPTMNEEVVLFLKYDKVSDCYYPALEPFQFMVVNDELQVKTRDLKVKAAFGKTGMKVKKETLVKKMQDME